MLKLDLDIHVLQDAYITVSDDGNILLFTGWEGDIELTPSEALRLAAMLCRAVDEGMQSK